MNAIEIEPDIDRRFTELARQTGRSKAEHIVETLRDHLDELEDGFVALARLQEPERRYTAGEVRRELDL